MTAITVIAILAAAATIYGFVAMDSCERVKVAPKGKKKKYQVQEVPETGILFMVIMAVALIVRYIAAAKYFGNETDMNCFIAWGDMIFKDGIGNFYSSDSFTDYPPGYMYILYMVGAIRHVLGVAWNSTLSVMLTKTPAIIADLATAYLLFRIAGKRWTQKGAGILTAIYLFAPAVLLDGAIWGQTDAVFTFFVVLMIYLVTERKLIPSYFVFAVAVLVKPQSLIFTPVLIYGIIDQVFLDGFDWKNFWKNLGLGLAAIAMIALLMLPFGFKDALSQYTETLASYKFASVNAYNIWTLFGQNWAEQTKHFMGITYQTWGTIFIILIVAAATWLHFRAKNNPARYYFVGAFIVTGMFLLSVRMHERYVYPAIIMLLFAFAMRPKREIAYLFTGLSGMAFFNMAHVEFVYDLNNFNAKEPVTLAIAAGMVIVFGYMVYVALTCFNGYLSEGEIARTSTGRPAQAGRKNTRANNARNNVREKESEGKIARSVTLSKMTKVDWIAMAVITLIYAVVAFARLGNMSAPETAYSAVKEGAIVLDFGETTNISQLWDYLGYENNPHYNIEYSNNKDSGYTTFSTGVTDDNGNTQSYWDAGSVFCWNSLTVNVQARYVKISPTEDNYEDSLLELVFLDSNGKKLEPVNRDEYKNLFDEQDEFEGRASAMNGTYFDEIYHGRTAYEMIHKLYCYENTHPPLGKIFIACGVLMFGMNPFGWRFMGTLFGVFMVPIIYLFAKRFFNKEWISIVTTLLFAFDFMHFVQTRIATIDVFVTLFIMLSYYFMYCYLQKSFYDTKLQKTFIPLGLCGVAMGLSWASKWTGIYSSVGLCILFFLHMYRRYREYVIACKTPRGQTNGISHTYIIDNFSSYFWKTIGFCCVFFVAVPVIIYILSYIPFNDGTDHNLLTRVINAQKTMFDYHSALKADHPYSSKWYEWPIMTRPIWYYSGTIGNLREGISAFGNPLVWWAGIPAAFYMLYLLWKEKDRKAGFLLIGYLSQYAPWFLVSRVVFIYHYFPSVPFVAAMVGYSFFKLAQWKPKIKPAIYVYVACAIGLFILFYPVLSGLAIDPAFATKYLKWFDSWVLLQTW